MPTNVRARSDRSRPKATWIAVGALVALLVIPATTGGLPLPNGPFRYGVNVSSGSWQILPQTMPLTAIHAAVLRTGEVLFAAGSGNNATNGTTGTFRSVTWDPITGEYHNVLMPWDMFCAGHSFLPDGRLLVAGGTQAYAQSGAGHDWRGSRESYIFDPESRSYERTGEMAGGRWYPTLLTLANGSVLAVSGKDGTGSGFNNRVDEVYEPARGTWTQLGEERQWPMYPSLFLLTNGTIFNAGTHVFGANNVPPGFFDPVADRFTPVTGLRDQYLRDQAASVLLPPAQAQRVMVIGGGQGIVNGSTQATTDIIDLTASDPAYAPGPSLQTGRTHVSSVILPDRTVLITGGSRVNNDPSTGVLETYIFDPADGSLRREADAQVTRVYHSFAVLLPDGRVLAAGGNPDRVAPELRVEIYSPPYFAAQTRPFIGDMEHYVGYGATASVPVSSTLPIQWMHLVRPAAVTHSMDTEQRLVALTFTGTNAGSGVYQAAFPSNPDLAPPGWYMLFAVDIAGTPSVARWVHLG